MCNVGGWLAGGFYFMEPNADADMKAQFSAHIRIGWII